MVDTINNLLNNRNFKAIFGTIVGTVIYCMTIVWILDLGEFYAGGVTGVSQLIINILAKFNIKLSISYLIFLFNVPLFIIGWKMVSRRFAYLSLTSVILQVIIIFVLEVFVEKGFNPFEPLKDDRLLLSILGGLLTGFGLGIILRYGSSSGGMDILSQYVDLKHRVPFANFSLIVDFFIICFGGVVGGSINIAIYTIIRLLVHIIVIDKIHTVYRFMKVTIYTTKKDEMRNALISTFNHGITIYKVIGGYTNQEKWVLESICSRYETEDYRRVALEIDEQAFITYSSISGIEGFFNRNVIT
ncbi:MAG TPA: YitT family protein [Acholeplasmataceae bacterium]|nr:YitT family protein [Acholeplasmataceae bacterium]